MKCRTWSEIWPGQLHSVLSILVFKGDRCASLLANIVEHLRGRGWGADGKLEPPWKDDKSTDTLLHSAVRGHPRAVTVLRILFKRFEVDVNGCLGVTLVEWNEDDKTPTGKEEQYFQTVLEAAVSSFGDAGYDSVNYQLRKGADMNCRIPCDAVDNRIDPNMSFVKMAGSRKFLWDEEGLMTG
jgi:hypothetical protein